MLHGVIGMPVQGAVGVPTTHEQADPLQFVERGGDGLLAEAEGRGQLSDRGFALAELVPDGKTVLVRERAEAGNQLLTQRRRHGPGQLDSASLSRNGNGWGVVPAASD